MISTDAGQMKTLPTGAGITVVYHFSDIDNLQLVRELGGLMSKERLQACGRFDEVRCGGNDLSHQLDVANGNWDKVSFGFRSKMPMAYHKEKERHLCYFVAGVDVCLRSGVIFSDRNAAATGQRRGLGMEGLRNIDFSAVKDPWAHASLQKKPLCQAEALIPDLVALDAVQRVVFRSESSRKEGLRLWGDFAHPTFVVDRSLFILPGPYVDRHLITSENVDEHNVSGAFVEQCVFRRAITPVVTLVFKAEIAANYHLLIRRSGDASALWEYEGQSEGGQGAAIWWPIRLSNSHITDGAWEFECRLDGIRQFVAPFTVGE
jgi:ssDNA thymidine ADP-ribosyltransferase, DarT